MLRRRKPLRFASPHAKPKARIHLLDNTDFCWHGQRYYRPVWSPGLLQDIQRSPAFYAGVGQLQSLVYLRISQTLRGIHA